MASKRVIIGSCEQRFERSNRVTATTDFPARFMRRRRGAVVVGTCFSCCVVIDGGEKSEIWWFWNEILLRFYVVTVSERT